MAGNLFDRRRLNPAAGVARRPRRFPVDDLFELLTHQDASVRSGALMALGSHARGDHRVIEVLVRTLHDDHSAEIRVQAVERLSDLGDPSVVPALKEVACAAAPDLRRAIAFAVANIEARAQQES